jgi:hypothetical protein
MKVKDRFFFGYLSLQKIKANNKIPLLAKKRDYNYELLIE